MNESTSGGVRWHRGGRPRGGEVTVAVSGFPMSNMPVDWFVPAKEALSVRIEEMKLPPLSR